MLFIVILLCFTARFFCFDLSWKADMASRVPGSLYAANLRSAAPPAYGNLRNLSIAN